VRLPKLACVVVAAALTAGCLQADTLVKVNADGTGTIEQTMLISEQAMGMMGAMGQMGGEAGAKAPTPDQIFNEANLKEAAAKLGPGVRFVSSQPVSASGMKGIKAVYAFDDVSKLQVSGSPSLPGMGSDSARREALKFQLTKQTGGAALRISMPQPEPGQEAPAPGAAAGTPSEMPPEMMGMMQNMLKGMKLSVVVQVNGKILKTDAAHHTDNQVTLVEVDMDTVMKDPAAMQALQGKMRPGASPDEMQAMLKGVKGVKMSGPVVNIEWR
jgi:hypothetical protein